MTGLALVPSASSAADVYWLGTGPGQYGDYDWSDPYNWVNLRVPAAGDTVHFRGSLAGRFNTNDMQGANFRPAVRLGQLVFEPTTGDVSQNWEISGAIDAGIVRNQTNRSQTIRELNTQSSTVDNASRGDAGAIYLNRLSLAGTRATPAAVTLNAGANGIVLNSISGMGNVTLDSPNGYVGINARAGVDLTGSLTLARGTLSFFGESAPLNFRSPTALKLGAGTALNLDLNAGYALGWQVGSIESSAGQATVRVASSLVEVPVPMSGSFIKTGDGGLDANNVTPGTNFDVRQGSIYPNATRGSISGYDPELGVVNLAEGATLFAGGRVYAGGNLLSIRSLTGSGSVQIAPTNTENRFTLRLTPTSATATAASISGDGFVEIDGTGSVEFQGLSTYSRGTRIRRGTVIVSAPVGGLGGGGVTVYDGGTLAGTGRVSGRVVVDAGGTIAPSRADTPGLNTGTFTVGGLNLSGGGAVAIEFNGINQGTQVDLLAINNTGLVREADLTGGVLRLSRGTNFFPASGKFPKVSIVKAAGSLTGVFSSITGVRVNDTYSFAVTYDGQNAYAQLADVSDVNLDNAQNYLDVYAMAAAYKNDIGVQTWVNGDLSGDGVVNYTDLLLVDSYVPELTRPQFDALLPKNFILWYDYGQRHGYAVPEPTSLAVLGVAGLMLGRRRRVG